MVNILKIQIQFFSLCVYCLLSLNNVCYSQQSIQPTVIASIKPYYNLIAAVTGQIFSPQLLITGNASPHNYTLKPSEIQQLQKANIILWGGCAGEPFLTKVLKQLHKTTLVFDVSQLPNIKKLPIRTTANWAHNKHCHHSNTKHTFHKPFDPHIWLSIQNANIIVYTITNTLSKMDPIHEPEYRTNASLFLEKLHNLEQQLKHRLQNILDKPYLVFHDAYQYFETHFQLNPISAITINPEAPPSAKKIYQIQQLLKKKQVACIFSEPQFPQKTINNLLAGTQVIHDVLDPLGQDSDLGPIGYITLLETLANHLQTCLEQSLYS